MYKKLFALIAGMVVSAGASAGYIRYDFNNTNSPLSGYFYQNDSDRSIAYFDFRISNNFGGSTNYTPYGWESYVSNATIYWNRLAPTNFTVVDVLSDAYADTVKLSFYGPSEQGIAAAVHLDRIPLYSGPEYDLPRFSDWYYGSVTGRAATPNEVDFVASLPSWYMLHTAPTYVNVPEPGSLALIALGAFGVASVVRRRKSAR